MTYSKPQQRKKEKSGRLRREREIRSSLLILDLEDGNGKLKNSGKEEDKMFHKMHVLGMNDDLWHGVCGESNGSVKPIHVAISIVLNKGRSLLHEEGYSMQRCKC